MGQVVSGARVRSREAIMERAARAAAGFRSLGVGQGDTVALVLRNDIAFIEAGVAAGLLGAYPTPVNWHSTAEEAGYLFRDSGARCIVIHADLVEQVRSAFPQGVAVIAVETPPEIAQAYNVPEESRRAADYPEWDAWLAGFEPHVTAVGGNPGSIIYTSGTTGRPKGVRRDPPTAEQYASYVGIIRRYMGLDPDPASVVTVITGPMYHSAPNAFSMACARLGASLILMPRFDPEELLALIETHRVSHLHMVPVMFHRLLKLPEAVRRRYDLSSLRYVVHAAAPCPPEVKRAMIEWWGPVIYEYYGSTETGLVTFCSSEEWLAHPGTVGRAIAEAQVQVIGAGGEPLPAGQIGEVVAKTITIADFTYHGDEAKRRAAEKAGLIAPGDIGYLDEDGFLHLCDRAKDMIISGGVNIYPAEIEAALLGVAGVADCAVFGVPDEEFGEAVYAMVQPQPGQSLTEGEVKAQLKARVAGYKVPRTIEFRDELPREDSGKIFKRKLREPFWEGLERRI